MNRQIAIAGRLKEEARWFSMDPDLLMLRAQQLHGEGDLGDPIYQEGLIHLAASLEKSASLSPMGRVLTYFDLLRLIGNALGVQRAVRETSAAVQEVIRAPLVITGLPRSGATFLHRLLAQDPAHRVLRHWEVMRPAHSPWTARWRRMQAGIELACSRIIAPGLADWDPLNADTPRECTEVLGACMMSLRFDAAYDVPAYREWLDANGSQRALGFHRQVLQLLQARRTDPRPRWILRSPEHLFMLPALTVAYPDARFILTHRDPLKVLPSVAHLSCTLHRMFSDKIDPHRIGARILERWTQGAELLLAALERKNVVLLSHEDIVCRPLQTMCNVYRSFGWELRPETLNRMERSVRRHAHVGYGGSRYNLSDYGFSAAELAHRFRRYSAEIAKRRFGGFLSDSG